MKWRCTIAILATCAVSCASGFAAQLRVAIEHRWGNDPLVLGNSGYRDGAGHPISITRLAYLLSEAKLQRMDGSWVGASDWFAYLDVEKGRTSFVLRDVPAGRYQAIRFDLGLSPAADQTDPAMRPPGHPLHPDVNGLHWGWRGGYVFLALEGKAGKENPGGYSYHLAGEQCRGTIEIPADLDLNENRVLRLSSDLRGLFQSHPGVDTFAENSTHSRQEDALASRLADRAVQMFAPLGVEKDTAAAEPELFVNAAPATDLPIQIPSYFPQVQWPPDNAPTKAGVALGRKLFEDQRLSRNSSQSCATCHSETFAFADPRPVSIGAEGQRGARNAMPLFNLAWKSLFFWDGRSPSLRAQVLEPIQDPNEMHETLPSVIGKLQADAGYPEQFSAVFGSREITGDRIARALEQYLLTLVSHDSKFDRSIRGQEKLSAEEQKGFELFFTEFDPRTGQRGADCFHCHGGPLFTDNQFHNNGLDELAPDLGREKISGRAGDRGKFATPSLRNVALTAPYMHDARFKTLEEVVEHYDHELKRSETLDPNLAKHPSVGLRFSVEEKAGLVAFLRALSDPQFAPLGAR